MKKYSLSTSRNIVNSAIICDCTFPYHNNPEKEIRLHKDAGFTYVSITVSTDNSASPSLTIQRIAKERRFYGLRNNEFIIVDTVDDILQAKKENKLAIGFHFQGTEPIASDLSLVHLYYKLGVRWMLIAYNFQNNSGTGCLEALKYDTGLSEFGKSLIKEMNLVGMIVDVAHTGFKTSMEAIEVSTSPCIISHANIYNLHPHPRNIRDELIKEIVKTNGIIGITGVGMFIGEQKEVTALTVFNHIDYIVQLVGPEYVGLGLDYMSPQSCDSVLKKINYDLRKVAMPEPPWSFFQPSKLPFLIEEMLNHGYENKAIKAILGGNFLRVAKNVWK